MIFVFYVVDGWGRVILGFGDLVFSDVRIGDSFFLRVLG